MKWEILVSFSSLFLQIQGSMLKCGEEIVIRRGEKKTLRFWSTDDELMKVEVLPEKKKSDPSALFAIFKDTRPSDHRESAPLGHFDGGGGEGGTGDIADAQSSEPLYPISVEIEENLNEHLSSRSDLSDRYYSDSEAGKEDHLKVSDYVHYGPNVKNTGESNYENPKSSDIPTDLELHIQGELSPTELIRNQNVFQPGENVLPTEPETFDSEITLNNEEEEMKEGPLVQDESEMIVDNDKNAVKDEVNNLADQQINKEQEDEEINSENKKYEEVTEEETDEGSLGYESVKENQTHDIITDEHLDLESDIESIKTDSKDTNESVDENLETETSLDFNKHIIKDSVLPDDHSTTTEEELDFGKENNLEIEETEESTTNLDSILENIDVKDSSYSPDSLAETSDANTEVNTEANLSHSEDINPQDDEHLKTDVAEDNDYISKPDDSQTTEGIKHNLTHQEHKKDQDDEKMQADTDHADSLREDSANIRQEEGEEALSHSNTILAQDNTNIQMGNDNPNSLAEDENVKDHGGIEDSLNLKENLDVQGNNKLHEGVNEDDSSPQGTINNQGQVQPDIDHTDSLQKESHLDDTSTRKDVKIHSDTADDNTDSLDKESSIVIQEESESSVTPAEEVYQEGTEIEKESADQDGMKIISGNESSLKEVEEAVSDLNEKTTVMEENNEIEDSNNYNENSENKESLSEDYVKEEHYNNNLFGSRPLHSLSDANKELLENVTHGSSTASTEDTPSSSKQEIKNDSTNLDDESFSQTQDSLSLNDGNEMKVSEYDDSTTTEMQEISLTTEENLSKFQDEVDEQILLDDDASVLKTEVDGTVTEKEGIDYATEIIQQEEVNQTDASLNDESPNKIRVESHINITDYEQEDTEHQQKPILFEKSPADLHTRLKDNTEQQNPETLFAHHTSFGNQELKNIMTQLKSQEALLSQPLNTKDESQRDDLTEEEGHKTSVDTKLNILKSIIKGIALQIASKDKTSPLIPLDANLEPTNLIYPTDADKETLEYLSNTKLHHSVSTSEVNNSQSSGSLQELNAIVFPDKNETENIVNEGSSKDASEKQSVEDGNESSDGSLKDKETIELDTINAEDTGSTISWVDTEETSTVKIEENNKITSIDNEDANKISNTKSSSKISENDEDIHYLETTTSSSNIDETVPSNTDETETSTDEDIIETTTVVTDEIREAYNKIIEDLIDVTTLETPISTDAELNNEISQINLDEKQETNGEIIGEQSEKFQKVDVVTLNSEIVENKKDSESENLKLSTTPSEGMKEKDMSSKVPDKKDGNKDDTKSIIGAKDNSETVNSDQTKTEQEKSDVEEIFIPFNFFNLFNKKPQEKGEQEIGNEHTESLESTTSSFIESEDTTIAVDLSGTTGMEEVSATDISILNENYSNYKDDVTENIMKQTKPTSSTTVETDENQVDVTETDETNKISPSKEQHEENSQNIKVINEDSIFSKETGSYNILSLIRNAILTHQNNQANNAISEENSFSLPFKSHNKKEENLQVDSEPPKSSQVIIKEQGSKVVIIKPQSDTSSNKQEEFSTPFITSEAPGQDQTKIETTTLEQHEVMEEDEVVPETSVPLQLLNDKETDTTEVIDSTQSMTEDQTDQLETITESADEDLGTYSLFEIIREKEQPVTSSYTSENEVPTPAALKDNSIAQESDKGVDVILPPVNDNESIITSSDHDAERTNEGNTVPSTLSNEENDVIKLLENYVKSESASKVSNENKDSSFIENSQAVDTHNENIYKENDKSGGEDNTDSGSIHSKFSTRMDDISLTEVHLSNHQHPQPFPYLLQTRKGVADSGAPYVGQSNIQHRRDDSQFPYGGDSPFFIKLPGSPNAVPVFLQYEPVEVKYVDIDKFPINKPLIAKSETTASEVPNDVRVSSAKENIEERTNTRDKSEHSITEQNSDSQMNVDLHLRPDPFFLMDPPNLGKERKEEIDDTLPNEDQSYLVDLEGRLNFDEKEKDPSVVTGNKPVYPGEYFIKNPDNSYSSSDTNYLTNSVFSLGFKVTLPSPEPAIPQYTPFPLTTNPPRTTTSSTTTGTIAEEVTALPSTATTIIKSEDNTTVNFNYSTGNPPSIEFSPAPSIDFSESYGPFNYPELPLGENADNEFYEDNTDYFPSAYSDNSNLDSKMNNKELLQNPKDGPFISLKSEMPPNEDEDFDIVALANFLHQNQKVWSNPKVVAPMPEGGSWRGPSWDTIKYSDRDDDEALDSSLGDSPWLTHESGFGEGRDYSAFYSPEEIPGLDPAYFSYRSIAADEIEDKSLDPEVERIARFIHSLPIPLQKAVIGEEAKSFRLQKRSVVDGERVYCEWNIKTEPGLYLLVTFHNLSAPYTVDCYGAYIEIERENNGYDARWCGNRALVDGSRQHVIFAKSEVRITVYDDGDSSKSHPTGFEADIEVIDLFNSEEYQTFIETKATPKIRKLMQG